MEELERTRAKKTFLGSGLNPKLLTVPLTETDRKVWVEGGFGVDYGRLISKPLARGHIGSCTVRKATTECYCDGKLT